MISNLSIKPSSQRIRLLSLLILSFFIVGCPKRQPEVIVIPSDREILPIAGEPGWYKISGGLLQELYQDNLDMLHDLEQCRLDGGK